MGRLAHYGELLDRMAERLEGKSLTRFQLVDMATVLGLMAHELEQEAGDTVGEAEMPQTIVPETTLEDLEQTLGWLYGHADDAPYTDLDARLRDAVQEARSVVRFLQSREP